MAICMISMTSEMNCKPYSVHQIVNTCVRRATNRYGPSLCAIILRTGSLAQVSAGHASLVGPMNFRLDTVDAYPERVEHAKLIHDQPKRGAAWDERNFHVTRPGRSRTESCPTHREVKPCTIVNRPATPIQSNPRRRLVRRLRPLTHLTVPRADRNRPWHRSIAAASGWPDPIQKPLGSV